MSPTAPKATGRQGTRLGTAHPWLASGMRFLPPFEVVRRLSPALVGFAGADQGHVGADNFEQGGSVAPAFATYQVAPVATSPR